MTAWHPKRLPALEESTLCGSEASGAWADHRGFVHEMPPPGMLNLQEQVPGGSGDSLAFLPVATATRVQWQSRHAPQAGPGHAGDLTIGES